MREPAGIPSCFVAILIFQFNQSIPSKSPDTHQSDCFRASGYGIYAAEVMYVLFSMFSEQLWYDIRKNTWPFMGTKHAGANEETV
jgi:hypothetical protein